MRMRTGRRFRTGAARGRGDGEDVDGDKVVGRACFPSLVARDPRRFARNAREARGGDGKTGPSLVFGDVTHRQPWLARRS
jgi:hypothetical protein